MAIEAIRNEALREKRLQKKIGSLDPDNHKQNHPLCILA